MFKVYSAQDVMGEPIEYYPGTDAEAYVRGEALVLTNGKLTKAGATATPQFICLQVVAAATPAKQDIAVIRTKEETEFVTKSTATVAATLIGQKVTMDTTATQVTATTTSGVFEISATDGVTGGGVVRGYFRR